MVDPRNVTKYDRTTDELEEYLLFCIAVANKNADVVSAALDRIISDGRQKLRERDLVVSSWVNSTSVQHYSPFEVLHYLGAQGLLADALKNNGVGCFNRKSEYLYAAVTSGIDVKTCTVEELESLKGVGMKTARYFVLHSRANARVACLDTHVLKWLSYYTDYEVPSASPPRKRYLELEQVFLRIADALGISPAVLDLRIWNKQRGSDEESLAEAAREEEEAVLDGSVQ